MQRHVLGSKPTCFVTATVTAATVAARSLAMHGTCLSGNCSYGCAELSCDGFNGPLAATIAAAPAAAAATDPSKA
jgi:hypothetical protein